ncbi:MAG: hypothetical protein D3909_11890, partial [Candidatus Electrothrix sp. ATG1]|nr:hypothetical protein [Candidatus Electrothrix sp. ATG1]
MHVKYISFCGQTVEIYYPDQAVEILDLSFPESSPQLVGTIITTLHVHSTGNLFFVTENEKKISAGLDQIDLALFIAARTSYILGQKMSNGIAVQGEAVHQNKNGILILERPGLRKTLLTFWLLSQGYGYLTTHLAFFPNDSTLLKALPLISHVKNNALNDLQLCSTSQEFEELIPSDKNDALFSYKSFNKGVFPVHLPLSLILFVEHSDKAPFSLDPLSPGRAAQRLMTHVTNRHNLKMHGFRDIANLTRQIPSLVLRYSTCGQFERVLDPIINCILESECKPELLNSFINLFYQVAENKFKFQLSSSDQTESPEKKKTPPEKNPIPKATPSKFRRKLTIGMATYDDFDGVYFSTTP